jgi:hypothetical protein
MQFVTEMQGFQLEKHSNVGKYLKIRIQNLMDIRYTVNNHLVSLYFVYNKVYIWGQFGEKISSNVLTGLLSTAGISNDSAHIE